jgi:hypothetical protein
MRAIATILRRSSWSVWGEPEKNVSFSTGSYVMVIACEASRSDLALQEGRGFTYMFLANIPQLLVPTRTGLWRISLSARGRREAKAARIWVSDRFPQVRRSDLEVVGRL